MAPHRNRHLAEQSFPNPMPPHLVLGLAERYPSLLRQAPPHLERYLMGQYYHMLLRRTASYLEFQMAEGRNPHLERYPAGGGFTKLYRRTLDANRGGNCARADRRCRGTSFASLCRPLRQPIVGAPNPHARL